MTATFSAFGSFAMMKSAASDLVPMKRTRALGNLHFPPSMTISALGTSSTIHLASSFSQYETQE
ncbi:MAG: hypothetical protein B7X50_09635 [Alishewanella sp. 34-51-39]|nr:MAG: hypothetical protein B7X50_09635 [Alishewanella sp. 34-51-39]